MCQVCKCIVWDGSVIFILVEIFMEYLGNNVNLFWLMLCECMGVFKFFWMVIKVEIDYFVIEFVDDFCCFVEE